MYGYLQEVMSAFTWVLNAKGVEEEGNSVVLWGCESNSAIHVIVIIIRPCWALQISKCLFIVSVTTLDKKYIYVYSQLIYVSQLD